MEEGEECMAITLYITASCPTSLKKFSVFVVVALGSISLAL